MEDKLEVQERYLPALDSLCLQETDTLSYVDVPILTPSSGTTSPVFAGSTASLNGSQTKKKKKKKPKKSNKDKLVVSEKAIDTKEIATNRPPVLCISRNKHWKYISSYHVRLFKAL